MKTMLSACDLNKHFGVFAVPSSRLSTLPIKQQVCNAVWPLSLHHSNMLDPTCSYAAVLALGITGTF